MDIEYQGILVEDDPGFASEFTEYVSTFGIRLQTVNALSDVPDMVVSQRVDLLILDQFVNGRDALQTLRGLRESYEGPVIILTGNTEQADRIIGLELGADDFIGKLQNPREIVARIRSVMRRSASVKQPDFEPYATSGNKDTPNGTSRPERRNRSAWTIDVARRSVFMSDGSPIGLTAAEFDMLLFFARSPGQIIGRKELFTGVFGREQSGPFDRTVDNLVSRLRRALGHHGLSGDVFKSIRGKGYIFTGYDIQITPPNNRDGSDQDIDIRRHG